MVVCFVLRAFDFGCYVDCVYCGFGVFMLVVFCNCEVLVVLGLVYWRLVLL